MDVLWNLGKQFGAKLNNYARFVAVHELESAYFEAIYKQHWKHDVRKGLHSIARKFDSYFQEKNWLR